jgi:3-oxoacyl-[acyl-carrier protein] reductase
MDLELAGRSVVVTGASRGIGRACAMAFAREKCRLGLVARDPRALEEAADEACAAGAPEVYVMSHDLATEAGCAGAAEASRTALGQIDVLVNNVGGRSRATFLGESPLTAAEVDGVMSLSLYAGLRLSLLLLPGMCARGEGSIVFITSIWGRESGGAPAYNIGKAAEMSLAKALAREALPLGVRVNAVAPGSILFPGGSWDRRLQEDPEATQAFMRREIPGGRFGKPEEVADTVVYLSSRRASWIAGTCIPVDGGQSHSF